MTRLSSLYCALLFLLTASASQASQGIDRLTLSLPESVLAEALTASLPLEYTTTSKTLQGNLRIINISELELLDQQLRCRLHLAGDQVQIITEVAGQKIRLDVGSVELDFKTTATLRFDEKLQTLYVTPVIENLASSKGQGSDDIGNAVVQLLNGKQFPLNMQDIDPIVTRAGAKTLTITTRVADIRARQDWLQIFLDPQISAN